MTPTTILKQIQQQISMMKQNKQHIALPPPIYVGNIENLSIIRNDLINVISTQISTSKSI